MPGSTRHPPADTETARPRGCTAYSRELQGGGVAGEGTGARGHPPQESRRGVLFPGGPPLRRRPVREGSRGVQALRAGRGAARLLLFSLRSPMEATARVPRSRNPQVTYLAYQYLFVDLVDVCSWHV